MPEDAIPDDAAAISPARLPPLPERNTRQATLEGRVKELEAMLHALRDQVQELKNPLGPIFLANVASASGQFKEVAPDPATMTLAELETGRQVTDDDDAGLLLIDPGDAVGVLRYQTGTNYAHVKLGGTDRGSVVRAVAPAAGLGFYSGYICKARIPKEWSPLVVMSVDTQTHYTNGDAFANGDYAKNLSDGMVYHRVAGAWVLAAGHLSDTDIDSNTDLSTQVTDIFLNDTDQPIIIVNMYEATGIAHMLDVYATLNTNQPYLARYWTTNSDGTKFYVIDGTFKLQDPIEDGNVVISWDANWVRDHVRMT